MVVHEHFAIIIPPSFPLEYAGPVMCAGITMYDPLLKNMAIIGKDMRVGVIGLGGLGAMGLKLAKALGCTVTGISRGASKKAYAMNECGADNFITSADAASMKVLHAYTAPIRSFDEGTTRIHYTHTKR
jgi:D-arabinose 1-dehydrogenase-like Zn-dependent alcohol dehydrogenase